MKESGRFFEKKLRKKFFYPRPLRRMSFATPAAEG
jgi:hypothetical protein